MAVTPQTSDCKDIQSSCEFDELNIASQSICLTGVYVTNNVKHFERCRGRVVKRKTNVLFSQKHVLERNEIVHFTNKEGADYFLHVLSNFGYSAALQNHNCDVEDEKPNDLHRFYRRSAFRVVTIGKWTPTVSDLSLSRPAIRFLKDIEIKLQSDDNEDKKKAQEDCIAFFKMFGTHVCMTHIDVGGIFSVSAQTSLLENDNVLSKQDQVRQVHNNAIISHIFEDSQAESVETRGNERDEYVMAAEKIEMTQTHFGGPQETCDFRKWKADLLKNPETWTVSDMGEISFENCIGIWALVKRHHQSLFINAEQLSNFLANTWHDHIPHGDMSNFVSVSFWKTFVKGLESTLSKSCSASRHLVSLRKLLHLLEKHVILVGKVVTNVVDMSSETSVQKLFTESEQHKSPINTCFQILTTKLKILQIDNGKSLAIGASWIASNYFIPGLLSQREFKTVEELLELLESEFLPGIDALEAYSDTDLKKVQSLAKLELLNTIQHFLQSLLDKQKYREALLLLLLVLSIGYHFKSKNILANITFEVLVTFIASAKGEIALARKYSENETQEAWLLLEIIFKLDTNYRVFDEKIVLENEVNDFVSFLEDKRFVFHSDITKVIYAEKKEHHGIIHSLAEICRFPCVFGDESMRTLHYKNPECCLDSVNSDSLQYMIKTFGMEKHFPQKLSTEDVLKLSDTLFTSPKTLEDIPWAIFRHAIAIDYNFRENILSEFFKKIRLNQIKSKKKDKGPTESEKADTQLVKSQIEDTQLAKTQIENTQLAKTQIEDRQLVKSQIEDKQLVKSKIEDIQLAKSKIEDMKLVKSKREDKQLVKSKLENRQLVKSKNEDRQLVKSKIEDTRLVKSTKDDKQLVKSGIQDRELVKSKNEDRHLVKSKIETRKLVKTKKEDKQLVKSKIGDRQLVKIKYDDKKSAKGKVEDKGPAKSKQEDKKLVKSKPEGKQPAEGNKEEMQLVQSKKEERQPAERQKEDYQPAEKSISTKYNPMDVFLALWHCCDPFLKKILAAKIFTCKFALPLIYRNITTREQLTISLWPIRDIFIDESADSVLNKPLKTVSFVRIGDLKVLSKSKIINKFLRGQNNEHNTFYHRDCTLGTNKRLLSNGLVEITWYVPTKDNGDVNSTETEEVLEELTQPLCILNMRGDAKCFKSQLLALLALSDVVVVMSEFENLNDEQSLQVLKQIHNSSAFAIVMTDFPKIQQEEEGEQPEEEEMSGEDLQHFYDTKIGLNPMNISFLSTLLNESDLKDSLTVQIMSALQSIMFPQSLERKKTLLPTFVAIDEDNKKSKYGSDLSETIFADVEYPANTTHRKQIKGKILPLQGDNLWHTWCVKQKECFRSVKKSVSDNVHHANLMKTVRLWQVMCCFENPSTVVKFINVLERHIDDRETITYFLQWMKLHLDCQSRQVIPKLSNNLYEAFKQYEMLRSQGNTDGEKVDKLKLQIKSAEENLAKASFGLEHIFREMGQLYESFLYCDTAMKICFSTNTKRVIDKIPYIAAKLLYWGHPLEIMDGDAASVPESWIKAVLKEIRSIIGEDKTLYVISVLGIQSSGKSTLLNTMFGLQFSVSAGRCTRGIYAQLIPVDKSKSSLMFDYALIIDTEGLRAPELAGEKFNHDNELATLVIGLADVAIINIKGETIADMQDVLQIVVHALIRLKNANENLNMKQSCVFVHQNVSASDAGKNTFQGSQKVTLLLDEMTKQIAEQEKMANITRFTDVIAFNPVTNVIHVPDLWQGIPPMAPASPEYSKKVVQVAKCILGDICKHKKFLNCENTSLHLGNLWRGIISEDFVFSFRNALEVKAYTTLEVKFQNLAWTLQELKLEYLQNTLIQIGRSETHANLQSNITEIKEKFQKDLKDKTDLCHKELQLFFDQSELSDYMIHWRDRKEKELEAISLSIKTEIHTKIESEKGKCKELFDSNQKLSSVKEEVITKAVEFAKSEKNRKHSMNKEDVRKTFELLWEKWLDDIAPEVSEDSIINKIDEMKLQLRDEIENRFSNHQAVYTKVSTLMQPTSHKRLDVLRGCITEDDIDENDIDVIDIKEKVKRYFSGLKIVPRMIKDYLKNHMFYFEKTKTVLDNIFSDIVESIEAQSKNVEYNSAQFIQVLNYITDGFRTHNQNSNVHTYVLTVRLEIKTALMVERYAVSQFARHIKQYEIQNSLRSKMTESKKEVEGLFQGMYFKTANEELARSIICDHLANALKKKLCTELHTQIVAEVTHSAFGNRKEPLIKAVLTDLALKHQFRAYMSYIGNAKSYVASWIENYTENLFEKKNGQKVSKLQQCIDRSLQTACTEIQTCAKDAEAESKQKNSSTSESSPSADWDRWIHSFRNKLIKKNFDMPQDCFGTLKHLKVENIANLIKNMTENIEIRKHSVSGTFKEKPLSQIPWGKTDPYKDIIKNLWTCDQYCPWCLEPCVVASSNDRHACKQHRPGGIAGGCWRDTNKLICESCEFSVKGDSSNLCGSWCKCKTKTDEYHPCKEYSNYMKEPWDIPGSSDMSASKYWNWVFKEFEKDFVNYYNSKSPDFSESDAFKVTQEEAIKSLSMYQ